jgi:putative hydrolase of the HAD superfamily
MPLSHIKGLIWDLDNTLYRFDQAFEKACNIAAARTVQQLMPNVTFEEAFAAAEKSYIEHGYSGQALIEQYGIAYSDYHYLYHDTIDESIIEKNEAILMALADIALPNILITHASRRWAEKTLRHLSMDTYFPSEKIIALEDTNFEGKAYSAAPFIKGLELLNLPPENVLVVEDTVKNLVRPKEMGMTTVLIHHGADDRLSHDHVDFAYPDTLEFLGTLMLAKQAAA